jgi:hypothetical protein
MRFLHQLVPEPQGAVLRLLDEGEVVVLVVGVEEEADEGGAGGSVERGPQVGQTGEGGEQNPGQENGSGPAPAGGGGSRAQGRRRAIRGRRPAL